MAAISNAELPLGGSYMLHEGGVPIGSGSTTPSILSGIINPASQRGLRPMALPWKPGADKGDSTALTLPFSVLSTTDTRQPRHRSWSKSSEVLTDPELYAATDTSSTVSSDSQPVPTKRLHDDSADASSDEEGQTPMPAESSSCIYAIMSVNNNTIHINNLTSIISKTAVSKFEYYAITPYYGINVNELQYSINRLPIEGGWLSASPVGASDISLQILARLAALVDARNKIEVDRQNRGEWVVGGLVFYVPDSIGVVLKLFC